MKYQTEVVDLEGTRFEVPLVGQPSYEGPLGKLYSSPKLARNPFADCRAWNTVGRSAFGQSKIYKDKMREDVDKQIAMMELDLDNLTWRTAHRTSADYQTYLEKNQGRVW